MRYSSMLHMACLAELCDLCETEWPLWRCDMSVHHIHRPAHTSVQHIWIVDLCEGKVMWEGSWPLKLILHKECHFFYIRKVSLKGFIFLFFIFLPCSSNVLNSSSKCMNLDKVKSLYNPLFSGKNLSCPCIVPHFNHSNLISSCR